MSGTTRWLATALVTLCMHPFPVGSQVASLVPIRVAQTEHELELITAVRELPDGSLLLVDRAANHLFHLPNMFAAPTPVGRTGDGPGEYRTAGELFPLGSDSSLFTDQMTGRWLLLRGRSVVETFSEARALNLALGGALAGATRAGLVTGLVPHRFGAGVRRGRTAADSLLIVRADMRTQVADTVARIAGYGATGYTRLKPTRARSMPYIITANPLGAAEHVMQFSDGWLAVVRLRPYRVDWLTASGRWVRGRPIPHLARPVNRVEQCAAIARQFTPDWPCNPDEWNGWPSEVPPFFTSPARKVRPVHALPGGHLAVERTPQIGDGVRSYDVIDRTGERAGRLVLERGEELIGTGESHVYVSHTDADDLQALRKYRWPQP